MKRYMIFTLSLALAFTAPAFAQDNQDAQAAQVDDQAAPADSRSMGSDAPQPASRMRHHRAKHHRASGYSPAAMALTGGDATTAAYQNSNRQKSYPSVDRGHVPGDPPVIDHSGDQIGVATPTHTTISVPPIH